MALENLRLQIKCVFPRVFRAPSLTFPPSIKLIRAEQKLSPVTFLLKCQDISVQATKLMGLIRENVWPSSSLPTLLLN